MDELIKQWLNFIGEQRQSKLKKLTKRYDVNSNRTKKGMLEALLEKNMKILDDKLIIKREKTSVYEKLWEGICSHKEAYDNFVEASKEKLTKDITSSEDQSDDSEDEESIHNDRNVKAKDKKQKRTNQLDNDREFEMQLTLGKLRLEMEERLRLKELELKYGGLDVQTKASQPHVENVIHKEEDAMSVELANLPTAMSPSEIYVKGRVDDESGMRLLGKLQGYTLHDNLDTYVCVFETYSTGVNISESEKKKWFHYKMPPILQEKLLPYMTLDYETLVRKCKEIEKDLQPKRDLSDIYHYRFDYREGMCKQSLMGFKKLIDDVFSELDIDKKFAHFKSWLSIKLPKSDHIVTFLTVMRGQEDNFINDLSKLLEHFEHKQKRWCNIHKTRSHTTEECREREKGGKEKLNIKGKPTPPTTNLTLQTERPSFVDDENQMLSLSHTQTSCSKDLMGEIVTGMKYILPVVVDGIVVNALLDSGANISLIRSSVIKDRVPIKSTSNIAIKTGKGNLHVNKSVNVTITMPSLKTQLKGPMQFLVPDDDVAFNATNGCDAIIGTNIAQFWEYTMAQILDLYENSGYIDRKNELILNAHISQELGNINEFKKLIKEKTWNEVEGKRISCSTLVAPVIRFKSIEQIDIGAFKPYSVPYKYRPIIRKKIHELLRDNVIVEAAPHPLMANVLLIPKGIKNEFRLVVDFTKCNEYTINSNLPSPSLKDVFIKISQYSYYGRIDLSDAYFQFQLHPVNVQNRDFTFFFENNCYSFTRLPQGAKNSAQIMYYLLVNTFKHDPDILWYADDAIIGTKGTEQEHIQHMVSVIEMLAKYKLRVKISKMTICAQEIEILGHRVNSSHSYPKLKHSGEILKQIKWPKTQKQIKQILGGISFFQRFIPNFQIKLAPITNLLQKDNKEKFNENHKQIYDSVVDELVAAEKIGLMNESIEKGYTIYSDASEIGYGGIILQEHDGQLYPIHFESIKRNPRLSKPKSSLYMELQSMILITRKHRDRLLLAKIDWLTDANHVIKMINQPEAQFQNPQYAAWLHELGRFNIHLKHIPGIKNCVADLLSRRINYINIIPYEKGDECIINIDDDELSFNLMNMEINKEENLYKEITGTNGIKIANSIFQEWHLNQGHQSYSKLKDEVYRIILNRNLTVYSAKELVKRLGLLIRNCEICVKNNVLERKKRSKTNTSQPFQLIYLDLCFINDLPIAVGIDAYSKYLWIRTIRGNRTKQIIQMLEDVMDRFDTGIGCIRSDMGKEFKSKDYVNFLCKNDIELEYGLQYEHCTNGVVERVIRTIRNLIIKTPLNILTDGKKLVNLYNNMVHETTGLKPRDLMFNFAKETIAPPNIQDLKVQMELLNRIRLGKRKILVRDARSNKTKVKKVVIKEIAKIRNPCVVANEGQDGRKNELISAYKLRELKDQ